MSENDQETTKKSIITRITDALFAEEAVEQKGQEKPKAPEYDDETMVDAELVDVEFSEEGKQESLENITEELEKFDWSALLRDIRTNVEQEGSTITKFMNLVESLEDVIPDESKRYSAAYKALLATSDKNRDDILADTTRQLNALKTQKTVFTKTVTTWRKRIQSVSERTKDIRRDINVLQEKLRALEKQERKILDLTGDKERQIRSAEVKFGDFIREIEQDINDFSKRIVQHLPKK